MEQVCQAILSSGIYLGRGYSYADEIIYQIAKGRQSAGTPTTWRELNVAHHITHIVRQLGAQNGETFKFGSFANDSLQYPLQLETLGGASDQR